MTVEAFAPIFRALAESRAGQVIIGRAAVDDWPTGLLDAAIKAKIASPAPEVSSTICPGCPQACVMDVSFLDAADMPELNACIVCDKPEDYGVIEVDHSALKQWRPSRAGLVTFLSSEFGLRVKDSSKALNRVRFGTSKRLRRAITLEFAETVELVTGDDRHDLVDLLVWDGDRVRIDWELLGVLAAQASETLTGGKRCQRSRLEQAIRSHDTADRNALWQRMAEQLRAEQPQSKKEEISRMIFASGTWRGVHSNKTIERVIGLPRKRKRTKLA